ncbi:MAG: DUF2244 domain-containing protein [Gammaproteobacteria bacterium]|jgi:uncharacterized membrane protein
MTETEMSRPIDRTLFVVEPNHSLSGVGICRFYMGMCGVSVLVSGALAGLGFWPVIPFAGLNMMGLGLALYFCHRRAEHKEVIRVDGDVIRVEAGHGCIEHRCCFERAWTRVVLLAPELRGYPTRLLLRSRGWEVEVGSCLNDDERKKLAGRLETIFSHTTAAI